MSDIFETDFMNHWNSFLKNETFDRDIFMSKTIAYPMRNYSNPVRILFLQGLQGSGKTTIAKYLVENLDNATYIEQDMFNGDTNVCLGALYHLIASNNGPKIIIISRCNINETHYRRYLDMCHHMPTIVTFLAPQLFDPLYLMISLAGIFERTIIPDSDNLDSIVELLVNKSKVPINDVLSFLLGNYSKYKIHKNAIRYNTYTNDTNLCISSKKIYKLGSLQILNFVKTNYKRLLELRLPISVICKPLIETAMSNKNIVLPSNPSYIGAYINDNDRKKLVQFLSNHSYVCDGTQIFYMQQIYVGGKMPCQIQCTPFMPGEIIKRDICSLVIRKSDMASAFKLTSLPGEVSSFYIVCNIPDGLKASTVKTFIDSTDDKIVKVIDFEYKLEMTGFWKV